MVKYACTCLWVRYSRKSDIMNRVYWFGGESIPSNATILLIFGTTTNDLFYCTLDCSRFLCLEYPRHIYYHYITGTSTIVTSINMNQKNLKKYIYFTQPTKCRLLLHWKLAITNIYPITFNTYLIATCNALKLWYGKNAFLKKREAKMDIII